MKKLYIYTTVEGFEGSWDEALGAKQVEIVATVEGEDQKTVEEKAYALYGDSDTYGWAYSAGKNWAKQAVTNGEPGEWDGLNITEVRQALTNANDPATPNFETAEEYDAFEGGVLSVIKII